MNKNLLENYALIEEIYEHLNTICIFNKKQLPPQSVEIFTNIDLLLESVEGLIDSEVIERLKRKLWLEWLKENGRQWSFVAKKRGFEGCFKIALEKSISLTLEDILSHFEGLDNDLVDLLEITEGASVSYFAHPMIFQYGSARTLKIYSQKLSKSEYKTAVRMALSWCKKPDNRDRIEPIDRWNLIANLVILEYGDRFSGASKFEMDVDFKVIDTVKSIQKYAKTNPHDYF